MYTGSPANNTSGGGYKEFYGLDRLINTGYSDSETNQACPAADSIVRSFGNLDIATNGAALVRNITNMYRNLRYIAVEAGLDPVKWAITMRWSAFYEITEVWPCAYLSYRCSNLATGNTAFIDSNDAIKLRDDMRGNIYDRTGQYLLIDGERVQVVIDDGITELTPSNSTVPAGSFRSTLYFVPLTVLGGTPVCYMEYLNFDAPGAAMEVARQFAPGDSYFTSDSGALPVAQEAADQLVRAAAGPDAAALAAPDAAPGRAAHRRAVHARAARARSIHRQRLLRQRRAHRSAGLRAELLPAASVGRKTEDGRRPGDGWGAYHHTRRDCGLANVSYQHCDLQPPRHAAPDAGTARAASALCRRNQNHCRRRRIGR